MFIFPQIQTLKPLHKHYNSLKIWLDPDKIGLLES